MNERLVRLEVVFVLSLEGASPRQTADHPLDVQVVSVDQMSSEVASVLGGEGAGGVTAGVELDVDAVNVRAVLLEVVAVLRLVEAEGAGRRVHLVAI